MTNHDAKWCRRSATAAAAGLAPGASPIPALLGIVPEQVEAAARAPRDDAPAPVPRGHLRVRFSVNCRGLDGLMYHLAGDVADYPEAVARDLITRNVATEVRA